jgi:hypothetical protein
MPNTHRLRAGSLASAARRGLTLAAAAGTLTLAVGCKLDVTNPSVIDASTFDPNTDGATISLSAQSQFYQAFQGVVNYGGYFAEEALSGAARTEASDIARRNFTASNPDINTSIFGPLSKAIAANERVITALEGGPNAASDINLARAQMNLGFSLTLMAETFCQGVILGGPALTPAELLDSAVTHFQRGIAVGGAATGTEAAKIVNASRIGLARAYLQKNDNANAAAAATAALAAPASFAYNVVTIDDASNRTLGNAVYGITVVNRFMVVSDQYRALNDPRVPWADAATRTQDGVLQDYQQRKYTGYATPIRIASYLEAQYVQAEANLKSGDSSTALTLIAARRTAGGQPAFAGAGAGTAGILAELMSQATRDFWLEGKKLGDWRRNGSAVPLISATGAPYKGSSTYGNLTCIPIPQEEVNANPNLH